MSEKQTGEDREGLFSKDDVYRALAGRTAPVYESALLKELAGVSSLPGDMRELFNLHFALFNTLYLLKFELAPRGYYLHIEPMRIRLVPAPGAGACHHYDPESGSYCAAASGGFPYCASHSPMYADRQDAVSFDPLLEFYLNPENIAFGESDLLKKLMNGVMVYAFRRGEVRESLEFFDLVNPNRAIVRRRYRELARRYHPDITGDDAMMKKLNRSYQVLCEVFQV